MSTNSKKPDTEEDEVYPDYDYIKPMQEAQGVAASKETQYAEKWAYRYAAKLQQRYFQQ